MGFLQDIFLDFLNYTHQFTRNYGWDIIILTIVIRIVLLPLTLSGLRGMKAMQQAQPRIKELQKKYKDDKERMNKEMMAKFLRPYFKALCNGKSKEDAYNEVFKPHIHSVERLWKAYYTNKEYEDK